MDASRLKQIVDFLLTKEKEHRIQESLTALLQALTELASSPQQTQYQTKTANALDQLERATSSFWDALTPAQIENLNSIGAHQYFGPSMVAELRQLMVQNAMTPAVVQQKVHQLEGGRSNYLQLLQNISNSLSELGVAAIPLNPGDTEIGVRFPSDVFDSEFGELVKTLGTLNRIFRFFSETITGATEPVQVRQISTTDPIFFLGLDATVAVEIGLTVTWLLNTLKQLFEIRKLRNETQRIGFSEAELKVFDDRIQKKIDESISERVAQILAKYQQESPRRNELEKGLKWSSRTLMAWIERGVTVEVRALRPPPTGDEKRDSANNETFDKLEVVSQQLAFPPVEGPPVLQLPPEESETKESQESRPGREKRK